MTRSKHSYSILRRLQDGPASNHELASIGGLNYRARVSDLRASGWVIEVAKNGVYRLVGGGQLKLI
jgi:biotin operon repressor